MMSNFQKGFNMEDEKKTRQELEVEVLDDYLAGLQPGHSVVIHRLEPAWCKGILGEFSISETSHPIDLKYLIDTWGGHKLRLKFRNSQGKWMAHRDIELYSFPPLLYGKPIRQDRSPHQEDEPPLSIAAPPPLPPPPRDDRREILDLMRMIQEMRSADMQAMGAMFQAQAQMQPQQQQADPMRMMQSAIGLLGQFQQMKLPAAENSDNDEVLGLLGKLAEVFTSKQNAPPPARITPGEAQPIENPLRDGNVISALSLMEPQQAIMTLQGAVSQMDPDKQAQTMAALIGSIENIGGTDLLLDSLEERGILGGADEKDTERSTSYVDSPDSRGEYGTDAGDGEADRESD